jgi:hypothetical protein
VLFRSCIALGTMSIVYTLIGILCQGIRDRVLVIIQKWTVNV